MIESRLLYMNKPKIVILFGAGASYGAGGIVKPPPLGSNLFEELTNEFPDSWGFIPEEYAMLFSDDFEEGMGSYYDYTKNLAGILKDMSIYFSKFKIDDPKNNLYWKFGRHYHTALEQGNITLATINYECLIELGISPLLNNINYWGESDGIRLMKIHGSCNFIKTGIKGEGTLIMNGVIHGPLGKVRPFEVPRIMANSPLPAAMSLYARNKDLLISPSIILGILDDFQKAVEECDHVIAIGIRPNVYDAHIWDYLKKMNGMLHLVGNEQDCLEWLEHNRQDKRDEYITDRFSTSFGRICEIIDEGLQG